MATMFDAAADRLAGRSTARSGFPEADLDAFLGDLGYDQPAAPLRDQLVNRVALLRAAGRMRRLFVLPVRSAPGLVFMGGEADPAALGAGYQGLPLGSLAGSGLSLGPAFESCAGEGIEYLSQFEAPGDVLDAPPDGLPRIAAFDGAPAASDAWVRAERLADGAAVLLPAARCLRRRAPAEPPPPYALGTGCGAGPTLAAATLHGLLELIERDAIALWWRGGLRPRPVALDEPAARQGAELLARLRRDQTGRRSWLLDITTDLDVPCIAAVSVRPDGRGLAAGFAARPDAAAAAMAAIRELCQIELGYEVVEAKRAERGEAAFNDADRRHLARATLLDAADCWLLHPAGAPVARAAPTAADAAATLAALVARLADRGHGVFRVDLTRPAFGVPVARVVAPSLQLEPGGPVSARLASAIRATGGGEQCAKGVSLL